MKELHCWKSGLEAAEEAHGFSSDEWAEALGEPGTCMLLDGHDGPHEWTPDSRIEIHFVEASL